ncbi:hypothetical protein J2S49_001776 [Arcanobacterium wilhelmae]|uniref:PemK-like, MazF-like toxin of type II toxin-antitoxin system n=1 Tax=Arcanobacterium wilhelmae TaxID=1803177 RepID=A0ABT9ND98_9ACTO|nr:type II toxin-antitoxin system PemK/MazF family toxin [Arcanobacterium wilhelmae]MDP9801700.1 hypothetical protein [Arcanobacterium wilhelmae]WFN91020.1 type II toxin-antitoxin system PemK/MazF family toxin [Arcanobacterium wilhelmae]
MAWTDILSSIIRNVGRTLLRRASREVERAVTDSLSGKQRRTTATTHTQASRADRSAGDGIAHSTAQFPGPDEPALVYDVAALGLPAFSYAPEHDGAPDPGEVVWTWIPYEENDGRGKDRPVLVVAQEGPHVIVAQLTSKDHDIDAAQEARWGRQWMDIGSGDWDPKRRPSEVRLDRLLVVHEQTVRREGGRIDSAIFQAVVNKLAQIQ